MSLYEIVYILTNTIYIFTIYKLFQIFFAEKTCNKKMKARVLFAYFIGLSFIIFITRLPIIMLALNLLFLFAIALTYKTSLQEKIFSVSLICTSILVVEILSSGIFGFFKLSGIQDNTFNSVAVLIFTRVMTLAITYSGSKYIRSLSKDYSLPKSYYFAFFVVLFGTLYLYTSQLSNEATTINHMIISGAVLITVNVTMIVINEKICNAIIMEHEQNIMKQQNEALKNQMEIINQSTEAIRLLKHDFKNHVMMLSNLYKNGQDDEVQAYVNTILGNLEDEALANSNNFVIDSIINFKLRCIKNSDIKFTININVPISIDINAHDLTAILGNLLDNAITACEKSKDKILDIKISSKMNNLVILINNSYDGKIINKNGKIKTTKLYKDSHGLGLTSIKKTLEKYDGEMRIGYTNTIFSTSIIIPY